MKNTKKGFFPKFPESMYGQGDRIGLLKSVLKILGNPDSNFSIIHVCGTNGKGSTTNMISNLLSGLGFKVGTFTSPFIDFVEESIQISGQKISPQKLKKYNKQVDDLFLNSRYKGEKLSYFEKLFVICLLYFSDQQADYVILECGLGGELDATNAINHSEYCIFTNFSLEHLGILGKNLRDIVTTASKIIKRDSWVIIAPKQKKLVFSILQNQAKKEKAKLSLENNFSLNFKVINSQLEKVIFRIKNQRIIFSFSLMGSYQKINLQTVLNWLLVFFKKNQIPFRKFSPLLNKIMGNLKIPGRFETVSNCPKIILDAAHNPDGVKYFVKSISELYPNDPKIIITGFLKDKDYVKCVKILSLLRNSKFFLVFPYNKMRGLSTTKLKKAFDLYKKDDSRIFLNSISAINYVKKKFSGKTQIIFVVGSFYLLKKLRQYILFKNNL